MPAESATTPAPTLELRGLSKRYGGDTWGLRPIDLAVAEGEFVVLVGPSGCGKSTTIRLIAGLEEPTAGAVCIDGRDVTALAPRRRRLSMVFQNYAVWPHLSVFENIAFALRLQRRPREEVAATVRQTAELAGIAELLDRHPDQLSGGQRQRVALARALAVAPRVFLLDEPLSNLDAKLRVAMRTELKRIHQATRATTLFVTHDQSEALSMADRIVVMRGGELEQVGTPEEVYFAPANAFVATFIGAPPTNLLDATLTAAPGGCRIRHAAFELPGPAGLLGAGEATRPVRLGIRPEDVALAGEGAPDVTLPAQVVEPQGSHQIVTVALGGEPLKLIAPARPRIAAGETLPLRFHRRRLHLFDRDTGARLG
jgi:multiple sugar transport system ATP-binding protein